jgi:hypothetical protein
MKNLESMSLTNAEITDTLFGREYTEASANDRVTTNQVLEANETLGTFLYSDEVADLVRRNARQQLDARRVEIIETVALPVRLLKGLNLDRLGIVVIRPEAFGLTDESKELLLVNGLTPLVDKTIQINFAQYWSLYGPGLTDPDARYDFPTRTLNYINKDIRVLAVAGDPEKLGAESVSDYITDKLKGRQGSFAVNTLRGDIAYTALKKLISPSGDTFKTPALTLALDPIGAYRKLVDSDIPSDRTHASADCPLLFYAGQSMHVPDNTEIRLDSRILLTEEEIAHINEELQDEC